MCNSPKCQEARLREAALLSDPNKKPIRLYVVKTPEGEVGFCDPTDARSYRRTYGYTRGTQRRLIATLIDGEWSVPASALTGIVLADSQTCVKLI